MCKAYAGPAKLQRRAPALERGRASCSKLFRAKRKLSECLRARGSGIHSWRQGPRETRRARPARGYLPPARKLRTLSRMPGAWNAGAARLRRLPQHGRCDRSGASLWVRLSVAKLGNLRVPSSVPLEMRSQDPFPTCRGSAGWSRRSGHECPRLRLILGLDRIEQCSSHLPLLSQLVCCMGNPVVWR